MFLFGGENRRFKREGRMP